MSEEIEQYVRNVYVNQLSIFKPFEVGLGAEFFEYVISEAEKFYEFKGVSPIIQQNKFEGFMADYFFLVKCLSGFMSQKIKNQDVAEKVALNIKRDFSDNEETLKSNGKLFLSILENLGYVVMNKNRSYLYSQLFYKSLENNINFVFCAVTLNYKSYVQKENDFVDVMKRIGSKKKYSYLGAGSKYFNSFIQNSVRNKEEVLSFQE